jgi:hypothetical protein
MENEIEDQPTNSDGEPMPVCTECGAVYPECHSFDCPEAQD